ncbi:MAG TPA: hypothetical protein VIE43_16555 [Thermoanaerobaculia bacterium]|jgi:hypothetical protein|nr:hypothetical protein [Thermoanaerobaculia bacterium]
MTGHCSSSTKYLLAMAFIGVLLAASAEAKKPKPAPIRPISIGVFWTPDSATYFGGDAGMQGIAETEIRDKFRIALGNSGLLASQGYDVSLATFPGVVRDDVAPGVAGGSCDLDEIRAFFGLNPALRQVRKAKKLSIVILLVQCHDTKGTGEKNRFGVTYIPVRPQDFKDPGTGVIVIEVGSLAAPQNVVAVHEIGHTFGGCHPEGCGTSESAASGKKPSAYPYGLGIYLAKLHPSDPLESDALGNKPGLPQLFFSHPGRDEFGRITGDQKHNATRAIRENWTNVYGLASLR